jgi:hypothetical protein
LPPPVMMDSTIAVSRAVKFALNAHADDGRLFGLRILFCRATTLS